MQRGPVLCALAATSLCVLGLCFLAPVSAEVVETTSTIWTFGDGTKVPLGHGAVSKVTKPRPITTWEDQDLPLPKIAIGTRHFLAVLSGDVFSWGAGEYGALGHGSEDDEAEPQLISALAALNVASVSAAGSSSFAVTTGGAVYAWGLNSYRQLGLGHASATLTPAEVTSADWTSSTVITRVAAGRWHTAMLDADGRVYTCGLAMYGQLGHNATRPSINGAVSTVAALQHAVVTDVAVGLDHTLALTSDGTVWAWGSNSTGQLGISTDITAAVLQSLPHPVSALSSVADAGDAVVQLAAGRMFSAARTSSGDVYLWGSNGFGQLGTGDSEPRSQPTLLAWPSDAAPAALTSMKAGPQMVFLLDADGDVWAWGSLTNNALGLTQLQPGHVLQPMQQPFTQEDGTVVTDIAPGDIASAVVGRRLRFVSTSGKCPPEKPDCLIVPEDEEQPDYLLYGAGAAAVVVVGVGVGVVVNRRNEDAARKRREKRNKDVPPAPPLPESKPTEALPKVKDRDSSRGGHLVGQTGTWKGGRAHTSLRGDNPQPVGYVSQNDVLAEIRKRSSLVASLSIVDPDVAKCLSSLDSGSRTIEKPEERKYSAHLADLFLPPLPASPSVGAPSPHYSDEEDSDDGEDVVVSQLSSVVASRTRAGATDRINDGNSSDGDNNAGDTGDDDGDDDDSVQRLRTSPRQRSSLEMIDSLIDESLAEAPESSSLADLAADDVKVALVPASPSARSTKSASGGSERDRPLHAARPKPLLVSALSASSPRHASPGASPRRPRTPHSRTSSCPELLPSMPTPPSSLGSARSARSARSVRWADQLEEVRELSPPPPVAVLRPMSAPSAHVKRQGAAVSVPTSHVVVRPVPAPVRSPRRPRSARSSNSNSTDASQRQHGSSSGGGRAGRKAGNDGSGKPGESPTRRPRPIRPGDMPRGLPSPSPRSA